MDDHRQAPFVKGVEYDKYLCNFALQVAGKFICSNMFFAFNNIPLILFNLALKILENIMKDPLLLPLQE